MARIVVPEYPHHVTQRGVRSLPIFRGEVKRAWEYPWSSAKFHIGEQKVDVWVKDRNLLGLVANWREFLQGVDSGGEKDLRRATKTGRPLVDPEHLARIEKKTGRNLQRGNPGRKPPDSMK